MPLGLASESEGEKLLSGRSPEKAVCPFSFRFSTQFPSMLLWGLFFTLLGMEMKTNASSKITNCSNIILVMSSWYLPTLWLTSSSQHRSSWVKATHRPWSTHLHPSHPLTQNLEFRVEQLINWTEWPPRYTTQLSSRVCTQPCYALLSLSLSWFFLPFSG